MRNTTLKLAARLRALPKSVPALLIAAATIASSVAEPADFPDLGVAPKKGGFEMDGYWIWCGSMMKDEKGKYHLFASRWPKGIPFHPGWMTNSEVVRATSDKPEGPYEFQEVVLPARGAEFWDGRSTHNPRVTKSGDTYLLYYMGSTHPFDDPKPGEPFPLTDPKCIVARSNKRIGVATAKSLEGPWVRSDRPILPTKPETFYSFLTSNPSPVVRDDGSVYLMFKGRAYSGHRHGSMTIGVAEAPEFAGPYAVTSDKPLFSTERFGEVEDPFVWKTPAGYEMIVKDMSGRISGEKYAGIHAWSSDGLDWKIARKPKSWTRTIRFDDGTTETFGHVERPFLLFDDTGRPAWLFTAVGDGPGPFEKMTCTKIIAIPLAPASSTTPR
jgi:hypothetical protein